MLKKIVLLQPTLATPCQNLLRQRRQRMGKKAIAHNKVFPDRSARPLLGPLQMASLPARAAKRTGEKQLPLTRPFLLFVWRLPSFHSRGRRQRPPIRGYVFCFHKALRERELNRGRKTPSYALLTEPNSSNFSLTVALIASKPGAKSLRGSKPLPS